MTADVKLNISTKNAANVKVLHAVVLLNVNEVMFISDAPYNYINFFTIYQIQYFSLLKCARKVDTGKPVNISAAMVEELVMLSMEKYVSVTMDMTGRNVNIVSTFDR